MELLLFIAAGAAALLATRIKAPAGVGSIDVPHPMLYVGTYGKYASGDAFGWWVDLTKFASYDDLIGFLRSKHSDEADPEFMALDYSGFPQSMYSEVVSRDNFNEIMDYYDSVRDMDPQTAEAYGVYAKLYNNPNVTDFEDRYLGRFPTERDFAEHVMYDLYDEDSLYKMLKKEGDWRDLIQPEQFYYYIMSNIYHEDGYYFYNS